jgi:TatD DNase family protein
MTLYVDAHCHLDVLTDPRRSLGQSTATIVVAVSELPSRYRLLLARFGDHPRVRVALGLHPLRAGDATQVEQDLLIGGLSDTRYVGEVGLDFSTLGRDSKRAQLQLFNRLLGEAELVRKVVTVHSRRAETVTIDLLAQARVTAILHWYSGPPGLVDKALAAGLYFSINPAMLRTQKGRETLALIPRNRVLTESDAPFARTKGRATVPGDIPDLVSGIARHWGTSQDEARRIVYDNMVRLYAATAGLDSDSTGSRRSGLRSSSLRH